LAAGVGEGGFEVIFDLAEDLAEGAVEYAGVPVAWLALAAKFRFNPSAPWQY
jgi:hypothetical protein